MGPIEIVFLVLLAVFGIIGIVRGFSRELGVTTILLLILFVLELLNERAQDRVNQAFALITNPAAANATRTWVFVVVLLIAAFIAYEGQTLVFPGNRGRVFFDLGAGLLNGYLLVGSIWYYLHAAGWPGLPIVQTFSPFYNAVVRLLPPAIFTWHYFIALVVLLMLARVWK